MYENENPFGIGVAGLMYENENPLAIGAVMSMEAVHGRSEPDLPFTSR